MCLHIFKYTVCVNWNILLVDLVSRSVEGLEQYYKATARLCIEEHPKCYCLYISNHERGAHENITD